MRRLISGVLLVEDPRPTSRMNILLLSGSLGLLVSFLETSELAAYSNLRRF